MLNAVSFPYFGKQRNLKYDINAIADIEREMKIGIGEILNSERMGFDVLRVMLWAGLKHEDQSLTPYKVGNHIQKYIVDNKINLVDAMIKLQDVVAEALKASELFDEADDEEKNLTAEGTKPQKVKKSTSASATGSETTNP